jgi:HD-GYP domain-containing protein (c-di-GMP phosphodiesterase class II)
MNTSSEIRVLLVGVDETLANQLIPLLGAAKVRSISSSDDFASFLDDPEASQFDIAIGGSAIQDVSIQEIAQTIRGVLVDAPIFYCSQSGGSEYNRTNFIKNGFTDAFLLPIDTCTLHKKIEEVICKIRNTPSYRSIKIVDLQPDVALGFDLYILLPQNKKYVCLSKGDDSIDAQRIDRLNAHQSRSAFVPLQQMQNFYDYSARKLKDLSSPSGKWSETERRERLQSAVRDLVSGIFTTGNSSFEESKQTMAEAGKIIETFVTQTEGGDWYSKVLKTLGDGADSYSHLSNISTFAALFSMATGIGKPEDLAIAGLFHDIGLSLVPWEIHQKPPEAWSPEEKKAHEKHPELTIQILKQRKLIISKEVETIILQHHERFPGTGYPLGLNGVRLKREAQILGIADEFDYLTRLEQGRPQVPPDSALKIIKSQNSFDPEIISKLFGLFSTKGKAA